jgi:hypothetical protein
MSMSSVPAGLAGAVSIAVEGRCGTVGNGGPAGDVHAFSGFN